MPPASIFSPAGRFARRGRADENHYLAAIIVTLGCIAATELLRRVFALPNPLAPALIAVVLISVRGGTRAGLMSAAIVAIYALAVFALGQIPVPLSPNRLSPALVICFVAPAMALMVGGLQRREAAAVRALRQQESQYRELIEQAPNAIVVQAEGRVLFVNDEAVRMFGATEATQIVGRDTNDFVHADSRAETRDRFAYLDEGGRLPAATLRVLRLDGSTLEVEAMSSAVRFGNRDATQAVLRDVTERFTLEREQAARALAEQNEAQFRLVAEAIPQIVWTANPDGWLDYYNPRWFEYTGMTLAETQGWGWGPVLHPDDLQPTIDRWTQAFTTGEPYEIEYRFKRASDGVYRWHLGRGLPVRGVDGNIVKWLGTCTDIEDQKRAVEALAQSEARVRSMIEQSPLSTALYDLDGRPIASNPAYARLWGRAAMAVPPGHTLFDEPELGTLGIAQLVRLAFEGQHVTLPMIRYHGRPARHGAIWVQSTLYPVRDAAGLIDHVALVQEDATARQKAEAAHHAAQERFRIVQDASPDGFALLRPIRGASGHVFDFEFLYRNPAGDHMSENLRGAEVAVGRTLLDVHPQLAESSLIGDYTSVIDSGEPFRTEYMHGHHDTPMWTAITAIRVGADLAITYSDVTPRRIAEQKLEEANAMLERRVAELEQSEKRYRTAQAALGASA
ncbi:MAG: PAS domain S-box protein [Gemmatimonadota bacterium]|nr:PAS domain S-box protein [Gemmatimonadota bacterium]